MPSSLDELPFQRRSIGFTPNVQERVTGQQLMSLYRCLTLEVSQFLRQEVLNPFFASFDGRIYETRVETVVAKLQGEQGYVAVYIDDLIVFSDTAEDHKRHLLLLFFFHNPTLFLY